MKTNYEQIVNVHEIGAFNSKKNNELFARASNEALRPAMEDTENVLFLAIDIQNDFIDQGELGVPNAKEDVKNATKFLYEHMEKITKIAVSLDTHQPQQIFHPSWWVDENGKHPAPFTLITAKQVETGRWRALKEQEESLAYVRGLETYGQKQLCIWPYHCLEGTFGAALEGQFANMVYFHSVARKAEVERIVKGTNPLSEMYGIIRAEYDQDNEVNVAFLNELKRYDKIIVAGEAKSHCVLASLEQITSHFHDDLEQTKKIYVLEDCMRAIPGFEEATEKAFQQLKDKYQIHLVKSTDSFL